MRITRQGTFVPAPTLTELHAVNLRKALLGLIADVHIEVGDRSADARVPEQTLGLRLEKGDAFRVVSVGMDAVVAADMVLFVLGRPELLP